MAARVTLVTRDCRLIDIATSVGWVDDAVYSPAVLRLRDQAEIAEWPFRVVGRQNRVGTRGPSPKSSRLRGIAVETPRQLRAAPPPFSDAELIAAFPEMQIALPELGNGTFKAAYRVVTASGDAVLKVVKEPASLPQNPGDDALPPRLDREITAMQRVNSRRVVTVLDGPEIRDIGGAPYVWYLEPLYEGGTLESRAGQTLSELDGLLLADALLEGVEDLWSQARLVHRDIKPGNIVFGPDGPVLLDLGIALHVDLTPLTNAFAFSPRTNRYAAPEQFEVRLSAPIDSRTDQFLVGIVVFEAVLESHPFNPDEPSGYLNRLMQGQLDEAALQTLANVSMQQVLRRLLRAKPHERYRTANQARRAVQGCLQ